MRPNRLKQLWREDRTAFGFWMTLGSPEVVELASCLDVDWLLLDAEHGAASYEDCLRLLQAMNGSDATPLIRVPWNDTVAIKRALDMGAEGILVPQIKTAEEVAGIVAMCRYPPEGHRGIGPQRASRYYLDFNDYMKKANEEIAVIVQIETVEAVDNLDAILAVPGLDAIFIGPADLSADMGYFPDMQAPEFLKVVDEILAKARKAGVPAGHYCGSGPEANERAAQGFLMVSINTELGVLTRGLQKDLKGARGEA